RGGTRTGGNRPAATPRRERPRAQVRSSGSLPRVVSADVVGNAGPIGPVSHVKAETLDAQVGWDRVALFVAGEGITRWRAAPCAPSRTTLGSAETAGVPSCGASRGSTPGFAKVYRVCPPPRMTAACLPRT